MPCNLVLESVSNLFTDTPDVLKIQISIWLTGRSYTNERQLRLLNGLNGVVRRAKPTGARGCLDDLIDFNFNNGRMTTADQVDFGPDRIDADDFVSLTCQAPRRNRANIP